jgi:pimeloyl-ACP methyl ester carboxylesterase
MRLSIATSFNNPDFVELVIHSYRHRIINALGDPRFQEMERELAQPPKINVPVISMYGADDGITKPAAEAPNERTQFPNLIARRVIGGAGHCLPAEKPETVSSALLELLAR